ncbi:MAG: hypothetical protein JW755_07565 [Candidatus Aminicenantes bacterium]|nr:hypothetical protein [Candidatus Aminicenantes bacterium]
MIPYLIQADQYEIQISYGRWSLSPFTTLLEKESENLVKEGLKQVVDPFLPSYIQYIIQSNIDFSSSGQFVSLNFWYNFKNARYSLGFKGELIDFSLPYTMLSEQTLNFQDFKLAKIKIHAEGEVDLRSGTLSLLGRWSPVSGPVFKWWLYGGMTLYFYEGEVEIRPKIDLETPIGNINYSGVFDNSIDYLRELSGAVPAVLFSPSVGTQLQFVFHKDMGLVLEASLSQGSYFSGGMYFRF